MNVKSDYAFPRVSVFIVRELGTMMNVFIRRSKNHVENLGIHLAGSNGWKRE